MGDGEKYKIPHGEDEQEILPNKLGLKTRPKLEKEEARGFVDASLKFTMVLNSETRFDVSYILSIHKAALGHLYSFAGKLRTVNLSKGGFAFPAARFLPQSMEAFQKGILNNLKSEYTTKKELISDIAMVHAELLFLHPFREGNGRTARLLANLMSFKAGGDALKFEKLDNREMFSRYVYAVQSAAVKNYEPMKELITYLC